MDRQHGKQPSPLETNIKHHQNQIELMGKGAPHAKREIHRHTGNRGGSYTIPSQSSGYAHAHRGCPNEHHEHLHMGTRNQTQNCHSHTPKPHPGRRPKHPQYQVQKRSNRDHMAESVPELLPIPPKMGNRHRPHHTCHGATTLGEKSKGKPIPANLDGPTKRPKSKSTE